MLSHANASSLDTARCYASDNHHLDNNNNQQQHHHGCSPDVSQETTQDRWYFDESGKLVSPQGACYTIAPSILKAQSRDAFNYKSPSTTLALVTSSSFHCNQSKSNKYQKQDHDGQQQQHPMTTSRGSDDKERQDEGESPRITSQHAHHNHQSHRRKRSRRHRGRKGNKDVKENNAEIDSPNTITKTSSSSPQHYSSATTTADQLTFRLRTLSMSSSTSSSPAPTSASSSFNNITTDESINTGCTFIDKNVSSFPASISSAAVDLAVESNVGSCGIDDRKHSELGGSHESNTQQSKNSITTEKKQRLYKTELCRNWEELQICRYGDKCQYAHGQEDLRDVERHPKYKTQVCRTFYQTGTCPYGTRCTFRHDENESHSSALLQRSQLQQPKLFHHHRNNRTCTYMTPAAWMTPHADAAQVSPTCPADSHNNVLLSSDAESLLPTGLLSDLDEPPSHIRPPVVGSLMLPCIPSSLVFQHGQQPFNHNIWKQHQGGSDSLGKGDLGTSTTTSSFL